MQKGARFCFLTILPFKTSGLLSIYGISKQPSQPNLNLLELGMKRVSRRCSYEASKGVFKETESLQEKHRINIKNKLGGAPTFFNQGGEL